MASQWTQDDVVVGDVRLHYYRTGHGEKPAVVLAHGFSDSGLCWSRVARDLEAEYDVVMPDMRGHGRSQRMRPGDVVDMGADLAGLIRGLDLRQPAVCGHSMGAMATFELAVRFPELVRGIVLEDPPWWLDRPPASHGDPVGAWAKTLPAKTQAQLALDYRAEHPDWPDELVELMAESKKQLDQDMIDALVGKVNNVAVDWQSKIGELQMPVLILTADPGLGAIVTPQVASRIRELNPRIALVNVPGVGHLIRYDRYPDFMALLVPFLRRVAEA